MRWTIGKKLGAGLALLCLVIGCAAVLVISQTLRVREARNELQRLGEIRSTFSQAKNEHLNWLAGLNDRILLGQEFKGELDPSLCAFGRWYHSFRPDIIDNLSGPFYAIEQPHRELHTSAAQINELCAQGKTEEAKTILVHRTKPAMGSILEKIELIDSDILDPSIKEATQEIEQREAKQIILMGGAFILAIAAATLIGLGLFRKIAFPIKALSNFISQTTRKGVFSDTFQLNSEDEVGILADSFNAMSQTINQKISELQNSTAELEQNSMELALGLSEYFEALRKIEAGDPSVRVSETSENEMLAKLGQVINHTAEGVASLVQHSHYMAMGLCENFETLRKLSEGDLTVRAPENSNDELLGRLGAMINQLADQLLTLADQAKVLANGDLSKQVELHGDLPEAFNQMAQGLRSLVGRIRESASQVAAASSQILAASEQQATGVTEQAAQVSETAASAKQLATTAKQVTSLATKIAESSISSVKMAHTGTQAVDTLVTGMEKIKESVLGTAQKIESLGEKSQAITEIVTLIEDIADQTNLLSLNAAVEAARAGEAGKGFAVVADAIGKLADRTAKSTKEISDLIKGIQQETSSCVMSMEESTRETEQGTSLAQEAGKQLREIVSSFEHVAQSAKEISLSSQQQTSGSEEISKAMTGIDEIMRQSASGAKQSAASARELSQLAEELKTTIAQFKLVRSEEKISTAAAQQKENGTSGWTEQDNGSHDLIEEHTAEEQRETVAAKV